MGRNMNIKTVKSKYKEADAMLNSLVEEMMLEAIKKSNRISCILKCMGAICVYDLNGEPMAYERCPAKIRAAIDLVDEFDTSHNCATGNPLKLTKLPDGTIKSGREW
jgi:hypothetical protein